MPKIIENLKENILEEARRILTTEGYPALTVRRVAGALKIGVGTIYNYYPSKLELASGVIEEDWNARIQEFRESGRDQTPEEVLKALFDIMRDFSIRYSSAWREYGQQPETKLLLSQYHVTLLRELTGYIRASMPEDQVEEEPSLPAFLAELILRFGADERTDYEQIRPGLEKLLKRL